MRRRLLHLPARCSSQLWYYDLYAALRLAKFTEWCLGADNQTQMGTKWEWFVWTALRKVR